ncbi:MAG: hypothetical protein AAF628_33875 [Planctomycetota bacterium]
MSLLDKRKRERVVKEIEQEARRKAADKTNLQDNPKSLLRIGLENLVSSAGRQAGSKLVNLGFGALTGGWSTLADAAQSVKDAFMSDD